MIPQLEEGFETAAQEIAEEYSGTHFKIIERISQAVKRAVLEEREACAKLAESSCTEDYTKFGDPSFQIAAEIRARK